MQLRESGEQFGYQIQIEGIVDPSIDVGIPAGSALIGLVNAFLAGEGGREEARRTLIDEAGEAGFVDGAAVFGGFEMMNRVSEGGIPVPPQGSGAGIRNDSQARPLRHPQEQELRTRSPDVSSTGKVRSCPTDRGHPVNPPGMMNATGTSDHRVPPSGKRKPSRRTTPADCE